jgi:hypothetical protein
MEIKTVATKLNAWLCTCLLLTACGTYVNPSNPAANHAQDKYACEQEALRLMPAIIAYRYENTPAECRAKDREGRCTDFVPPIQRSIPYDTNESARSNLAHSCVKARGWVYQSK